MKHQIEARNQLTCRTARGDIFAFALFFRLFNKILGLFDNIKSDALSGSSRFSSLFRLILLLDIGQLIRHWLRHVLSLVIFQVFGGRGDAFRSRLFLLTEKLMLEVIVPAKSNEL